MLILFHVCHRTFHQFPPQFSCMSERLFSIHPHKQTAHFHCCPHEDYTLSLGQLTFVGGAVTVTSHWGGDIKSVNKAPADTCSRRQNAESMSAELHPSAASMSSNTSMLLLITLWASVQEGLTLPVREHLDVEAADGLPLHRLRPKRCACSSLMDSECHYFCHLDIIWVNTPR